MQSLLEDPEFYNLLLNNRESLLDSSTETPTPIPSKLTSTDASSITSVSPSHSISSIKKHTHSSSTNHIKQQDEDDQDNTEEDEDEDEDNQQGLDEDMQNQMTYPGQRMMYATAPPPPQQQQQQHLQHHQIPQQQQQQQQLSHPHMAHQQNNEMLLAAQNGLYYQEHHTEPPQQRGIYGFHSMSHQPHLQHQQQQQQTPIQGQLQGQPQGQLQGQLQHQQMGPPRLPQQQTNRSSGDTSSYQQSVFSDNMSMSTETLDGMSSYQQQGNATPVDDFFMKEVPNQIRTEMGQLNADSSDSAQKRFHRFYTTTAAQGYHHATSPTVIPSLPSCTPNPDFKIQKGSASNYHKCPFCQRSFKNKSYLARHLKKHDTIKDFKCPFFNPKHTKCHHLNGEFSRKDTFKAHLKSIHFIYPIGVAKSDRNDSPGRCAGCFKEFNNNTDWLTNHIETEECTGFAKFKGDE